MQREPPQRKQRRQQLGAALVSARRREEVARWRGEAALRGGGAARRRGEAAWRGEARRPARRGGGLARRALTIGRTGAAPAFEQASLGPCNARTAMLSPASTNSLRRATSASSADVTKLLPCVSSRHRARGVFASLAAACGAHWHDTTGATWARTHHLSAQMAIRSSVHVVNSRTVFVSVES